MKKTLILLTAILTLLCLLAGCTGTAQPGPAVTDAPATPTAAPGGTAPTETPPPADGSPVVTGSLPLSYAQQFTVDYYSDGSALITIGGTDKFLLLPEGAEPPANADPDLVLLRQPLTAIYNASSAVMDMFIQLDSLDRVRFTSTTYGNWGLPEVRDALDAETLIYAGKYSAPDFELLLEEKCTFALENTMIYHSPDIKEQLENLDIPVMVERSSYEPHPLGRVEWIKLYGLLLGKEAEAEAFFNAQVRQLDELGSLPSEGMTVAYFHISTARTAVVRKPGDYVSKMIELAGGHYVFSELPGQDDSAMSTMSMQLESFYAGAKDADVLIYNSTIDGELETVAQLLEKSELLSDFKAVKAGEVWCSEHDLFQKSSAAATIIRELNLILSGRAEDEMQFFHRLK